MVSTKKVCKPIQSMFFTHYYYSSTFLCRKKNLRPKLNIVVVRAGCLFWYQDLDRFRQVFVHYLMSILMLCKYTGGYIYQVVLGNSLSLRLTQKKNTQEKFPFTSTHNWILVAVRWSVKYFFAPNSPIFRKKMWQKSRRRRSQAIAKR